MNIVVTGASKGIGHAIVRQLAGPDHTIIALSRNGLLLEELREECLNKEPASRVIPVVFDLMNIPEREKELFDQIRSAVSTIDVLINNAGFLVNKPFGQLEPEDVENCLKVNFSAPLYLIRCLMPLLEKATKSHVVNIGSMAGQAGSKKFPGLSVYSSSKAALATLTECLAEEYKEKGIKFNCLALGAVQTEMLAEAFPDLKAPLQPEEMASFIADFSVNGGKYFNGKVLPVALGTP